MIDFAWPWLFILLPLPWLIAKVLPPLQQSRDAAILAPSLRDFEALKSSATLSTPKLKTLLAILMWGALLTAAARPQWVGEWVEIPQTGRDLMLAVDLSQSMQLQDFEVKGQSVDRLTALKLVAGDFIERRKGDRIGLILFGSKAYLQAPLTFDTATVKQLLMESSVGLAGGETALGDAIALAVKQVRSSKKKSSAKTEGGQQVLILLTDGVNNTGEFTPDKAAELAEHAKLKIHTIAIGSKELVIQTPFGPRRVDPSKSLDEKGLQAIAAKTGGKYFRAYDAKELAQIYQEIDQLEAMEHTDQHYRPIIEVYYWPLLFAIICFGTLLYYRR